MGKTPDLTVVQKIIIDTLHKEGKPQTFIAKETDCSQSAVSEHVNRKLSGRKKCGRKRCTTNRRGLSSKIDSRIWVNFTRNGLRLGSRHQEPFVKPLLNHRQRQRRLTWAKEKKKWTVAQWSKVLFSDESKFCIIFGNQGPRPIENLWGIVKRKMRNKRPKNADELKATVKETWASIPPQQCHRLITSTPN
ncbi:Transposable element Tc1 transposase [Labeo rohita]|uniref:Transposable element Tc1 transposase n=1 Tax=Labeo rohita TaxID=84645 RepID=A0ABQ8LUG6_LABRO|nr:Transposable element Tc1 transposase [Labeo rohita]